MMRAMRWWSLLWLVPSMAFAQDARTLFEEGTALYEKRQFAAAAEKFDASYAARPLPLTRFNAARAWEQAGETLKAIDAWQSWLSVIAKDPDRPEAEASLKKLSKKLSRLGVQALTVTTLPVGARIFIDGIPRGLAPLTLELPAGRHLIRVEQDGRKSQERSIDLPLELASLERFELPEAEVVAAVTSPPARNPLDAQPLAPVTVLPVPLPAPEVPRRDSPDFAFAQGDDAVLVHLESNQKETRLYRFNGNPNGECRAPCDVAVARITDHFFVAGGGMSPSATFVLADHQRLGRVHIKVKGGSATAAVFGAVGLGMLGVGGIVGGAVGAFQMDSTSRLFGYAGIGLGIGCAISAIILAVANGTVVTFPSP